MDADVVGAPLSVRTTRLDANIYWLPFDRFRLGAEIGFLRTELAANGSLGLLPGASGDAVAGYLSAKWNF